MAPSKSTKFKLIWLDQTEYPDFAGWLSAAPNDVHSARCEYCKKTFSLSNMGVGAVKCHAKGNEHQLILKRRFTKSGIFNYLTPVNSSAANDDSSVLSSSADTEKAVSSTSGHAEKIPQELTMKNFLTKDEVLKSEIVWALNVVEKRMSLNSCANISKIFKIMFSDSAIAQQFQLGKDKVSYIIHYGIAHYFHEALIDIIKDCDNVTICFDESLNKVVQKGQMDLFARFWLEEKVCTRYIGSVFLGRATAQDLLESFLKAMDTIPLHKLLHVSMDGPNVNLSFLKKLQEHILEENPSGKQLVQMGTCGLHVIHGAIKTGIKAVDWDIFGVLRNLYYLFKDSPARRAEFTHLTDCTKFPKKFCAVRWLENSDCLERAIEIVDPVLKYLLQVKRTDSKVNVFLQKSFSDPLIKCKLAFFRSLSLHCEIFLKKFQSEAVLVPYLHSELSQLLGGIMKKFIKADRVVEGSGLLKIDIKSKNNLVEFNKIDIGFSAKKFLKEAKVTDKISLAFRMECQKILQAMTSKIVKKSPLKYKIVRGLSSLHPSMMLNNPSIGLTRFIIVLEMLHDANHITETVAEQAKHQYSSFCSVVNESYKEEFASFLSDKADVGLDQLYYKLLSSEKKFADLWNVVKICFILSHGNASVEGGFSVNKTILVENLQEESLVNQRRVFDGIKAVGGAANVKIDKKMLLAVRAARQRYRQDLERKKGALDKITSITSEKRKIENELKDLESKRRNILLNREKEENEVNEKIQILESKKRSLL